MNREDLRSLRRWGEGYPESETSTPRMVVRLLDEREMLLDALREITFDNRPGGGAYDRACRAIEKADAP